MIEDIARAIFNERFGHCVGEHWENASEADKQSHRDMARAAIKSLREPSPEMLRAADEAMRYQMAQGPQRFETLTMGWNAMLNAADGK